jgi:hypothetical protein
MELKGHEIESRQYIKGWVAFLSITASPTLSNPCYGHAKKLAFFLANHF